MKTIITIAVALAVVALAFFFLFETQIKTEEKQLEAGVEIPIEEQQMTSTPRITEVLLDEDVAETLPEESAQVIRATYISRAKWPEYEQLETPYLDQYLEYKAKADAGDAYYQLRTAQVLSGCVQMPSSLETLDLKIREIMTTYSTKPEGRLEWLNERYEACKGMPRDEDASWDYYKKAVVNGNPLARMIFANTPTPDYFDPEDDERNERLSDELQQVRYGYMDELVDAGYWEPIRVLAEMAEYGIPGMRPPSLADELVYYSALRHLETIPRQRAMQAEKVKDLEQQVTLAEYMRVEERVGQLLARCCKKKE